MRVVGNSIILDADDEEPDCMTCDNCLCGVNICSKCGPEYWWKNYVRTTTSEEYYGRK